MGKQYNLLWIGNEKDIGKVGIFLAKRYIDKVIDVRRVRDRMIVTKVLVQGIIISKISVYVPQYGLDDSMKDDFYDSLANIVRKLGEEIVVLAGDFDSHVGSNPEKYEDHHGGYGFRYKEKRFLNEHDSRKYNLQEEGKSSGHM